MDLSLFTWRSSMRLFGSLQVFVALAVATSLIAFLSHVRNVHDIELSSESPSCLVSRGIEPRQITDGPRHAKVHATDISASEPVPQ